MTTLNVSVHANRVEPSPKQYSADEQQLQQKGKQRTAKSKGITRPVNQARSRKCYKREHDEFLENVHISSAMGRRRKGRIRSLAGRSVQAPSGWAPVSSLERRCRHSDPGGFNAAPAGPNR